MAEHRITKLYFEWLVHQVCEHDGYNELFKILYETNYQWVIDRDEARYSDGLALRDIFLYEQVSSAKESELLYRDLRNKACSLLEMLVALSRRSSEYAGLSYCSPVDIFWYMMTCSGLKKFSDECFDIYEVNKIIDNMLSRRYSRTGRGGLFIFNDNPNDMRDIELWDQAKWHLNTLIR